MRPTRTLAAALVLGLAASASAQGPNGANFREMFLQLDTNGDTVLERDEIPESGRAAFDRLVKRGDANKNGKLEADEMRDLGKKLTAAMGTPTEFAAERLKAMDKDGDGKISKAEFKGIPGNFPRIDADGDGSLSRDELLKFAAAAQRPAGAGAVPPAALKGKSKAKSKVDAAKPDAKTDVDAAKTASKPAETPKPDADAASPIRRFKAMDKDGDGKVSKAEFPREKLFDRLDTDNDGFLTPAELAKFKKPGA